MSLCEYCKNRFTWDCDDGLPYPMYGCESFELEFNILSRKKKYEIKRILLIEEFERDWGINNEID